MIVCTTFCHDIGYCTKLTSSIVFNFMLIGIMNMNNIADCFFCFPQRVSHQPSATDQWLAVATAILYQAANSDF